MRKEVDVDLRGTEESGHQRKVGQFYDVLREFKKSRGALIGGGITMIVFLIAIFANIIFPDGPFKMYPGLHLQPPSSRFWFGTDALGRDVLTWVVWGARISLMVGFGAVAIETLIGIVAGFISGYYGGWIDEVIMRLADTILVLPTIMLLIVAVSMFKVRSILLIISIMGLLGWPWMARVVRSETLVLKESLFVTAAKSFGASDFWVILRHIFPNALPSIIVMITLDMPSYILWESTISFLGLGDPNSATWGLLLNFGKIYLRRAWWITTFPGLAIFFTCFAFNLLGDGLRDAFDVRARR